MSTKVMQQQFYPLGDTARAGAVACEVQLATKPLQPPALVKKEGRGTPCYPSLIGESHDREGALHARCVELAQELWQSKLEGKKQVGVVSDLMKEVAELQSLAKELRASRTAADHRHTCVLRENRILEQNMAELREQNMDLERENARLNRALCLHRKLRKRNSRDGPDAGRGVEDGGGGGSSHARRRGLSPVSRAMLRHMKNQSEQEQEATAQDEQARKALQVAARELDIAKEELFEEKQRASAQMRILTAQLKQAREERDVTQEQQEQLYQENASSEEVDILREKLAAYVALSSAQGEALSSLREECLDEKVKREEAQRVVRLNHVAKVDQIVKDSTLNTPAGYSSSNQSTPKQAAGTQPGRRLSVGVPNRRRSSASGTDTEDWALSSQRELGPELGG
jgi:DNA repair exonuclease SbcCD ATPase subunit